MNEKDGNKLIPLSVPHIIGKEWQYVKECLDTGWVSSVGKYVDKFEEGLANYIGVKKTVCCVNGTSALHIALKVLEIGPGDEVIVPTLTFIAPVNAVKYVGAEPVFMDCDDNYNLDIEKFENFLLEECEVMSGECFNVRTRKRIKAVIPVHLFGTPVDMDPLIKICKKYDIKIIEDACEALGSEYKGKKVGSLGDIACFSFNGNKIITTGAGGALVTNNEKLAEKAKYLTRQAKDDPVDYVHHEIGYNYRMSNVLAAMGVGQLEKLDEYVKIKRKNHAKYVEKLSGSLYDIYMEPKFCKSNYWFYNLQVKDFVERDEISLRLKKNGIQARTAWSLIHLQRPYKNCQSYKIEKAFELWKKTLSIPCSIGITDFDIDKVCAVIKGKDAIPKVEADNRIVAEKEVKNNDKSKRIIIVGAGCHSKVVLNVLLKTGWEIYGYIDVKENKELLDVKYLGDDLVATEVLKECKNVVIGVNMQAEVRKKLFDRYKNLGYSFPAIVSPDAVVSSNLEIGEGSMIMDGVVVQPFVKIGKNCIVNTSASIDHDCVLGDNVNICPGVVVAGGVKFENDVFVGIGSTLIQSLNICNNVTIGAGAVVVKDLVEKGTYLGIPARKKEKEEATSEVKVFEKSKKRTVKDPVYIIAEAGVNHNGDMNLAKRLVDVGVAAGVDAVKFQTFRTELLVTEMADQAEYQKETANADSQFAILKKLELTEENFAELRDYCNVKGVDFLSTPHSDKWSVDVLDKLGVSSYKLGSGDLTNLPILKYIAGKCKPVIISTGMATMDEVVEAKETLFNAGNEDIVILHCTTSYPCLDNLVNLRAMKTVSEVTGCIIGYSDHTLGIEAAVIATALGAVVYEKHFTLDKTLPGPDHQASLDPQELERMVKVIRFVHENCIKNPHEAVKRVNSKLGYNLDESKVEVMLGSSEKKPHQIELDVAKVARKSIILLRDVVEGEVLTEDNLGIKRPGEGLHPRLYEKILGRKVRTAIKKDAYLNWGDLD
jgi:perosamine synthetase